MRLPVKLSHLPPRLAAGAFILDSGLSKLDADEQTCAGLHAMATGAYPFLNRLDPQTFVRLWRGSEIMLGAALLLPAVPTGLAGAGLSAFSGGLVGLYLRTPGWRREDGIRPSPEGLPYAKDVWLFGMGLGLMLDGVLESGRRDR